jgi:hypothetical protein
MILVFPRSTNYMLTCLCLCSFFFVKKFDTYSINSSTSIDSFPEDLNLNHSFLKLNWVICNLWSVLSVGRLSCFKYEWFNSRILRATPHTRLRARDHYTSSTLIGGKGGAGPSSLHITLEGPTEWVCEYKLDGKVDMDSYMASNGSCFMVTWIIFKNHLLEVGLTQNRETMILWTLTTVDLFYFIMCEDLHE